MQKFHLLLLTGAVIAMTGFSTAFQETNKLLGSFEGILVEGAHVSRCFQDLKEPHERVGKFLTDSIDIYDGLTTMNQRVGTINAVASTILLIPGINKLGALVLIPLTTGLTWTSRSISVIQTGTEPIINAMREWDGRLKSLPGTSQTAKQTFQDVVRKAVTGKQHVGAIGIKITMVECGPTRANLLGNMENTAHGMDAIPNMVIGQLSKTKVACHDVKNFLTTTSNKIDTEVTITLSVTKAAVGAFNSALDPLQVYLDEINAVLDRRLCLSDVNVLLEQVPDYRKPIEEAVETVKETAETAVNEVRKFFRRFGRRRRNSRETGETNGEGNLGDRKKRDVCVTVRQVLDGSLAVDGGYTAVSEFLVREVFNRVMPKLPGVTSDLTKMAKTLLPFASDFNLEEKSAAMEPDQVALSTFTSLDYESTFWEKPEQSDVTVEQTCEGETALDIPS